MYNHLTNDQLLDLWKSKWPNDIFYFPPQVIPGHIDNVFGSALRRVLGKRVDMIIISSGALIAPDYNFRCEIFCDDAFAPNGAIELWLKNQIHVFPQDRQHLMMAFAEEVDSLADYIVGIF